MDNYAMYMVLMEQFDEDQYQRRDLLRDLRDHSDPLSMADSQFEEHFRLSKEVCQSLIPDLQPHDVQSTSLPFVVRFFTSLHFFANGSYQKCVGTNYVVPMSQSSVSRAIRSMAELIMTHKANEIAFPITGAEQLPIKAAFYSKFGMKGVIGAIDCTHVQIVCPPKNDPARPCSTYMNRKGTYSLNAKAVCNEQLQILSFNARYPGSVHDSGIWTTSPVSAYMSGQRGSWLLGDRGYPLEPWLLTPFGKPATPQEECFNKVHCKARNVIERCFGVLKGRFRCLSKQRTLYCSPLTAGMIGNAFAVLHNIAMKTCAPPVEAEEADEDVHPSGTDSPMDARQEGVRVRHSVMLAL